MYATYITEALVCGTRDSYTSDRSYLLLTKRAGMLWAAARSVREEKSRQRYALQNFSLIRVSLVKGKSGWRIGSVESEYNAFSGAASREARGAITRIVKLLRQYLHGEETVSDIFLDVKRALSVLQSAQPKECNLIADIFALRLLNKLGYIAGKPSFAEHLSESEWEKLNVLPVEAYRSIENAQKVSHL